jgi:hypothetical protein
MVFGKFLPKPHQKSLVLIGRGGKGREVYPPPYRKVEFLPGGNERLVVRELPALWRGLNNIKDKMMEGSFMAPSIIFNRNNEQLAPRHLPPLGSVQGAFSFKGFAAVGSQPGFPIFAVKEPGSNHAAWAAYSRTDRLASASRSR